jgi:hypothetical protein
MQNILPIIWRRIHALEIPRASALTAAQQTMLTWAKIIESYANVPKTYQAFFEPLSATGQGFPYTILTPSREGFMYKTSEKLICDLGYEIHVLERSADSFTATCYPIEGISCVEFKSILLDAYIKISGITRQGIPSSSTIKFNSVTDYLFKPIVEKIRYATFDSKDAAKRSEAEKFDHLVNLNFKFMNYARRSLLAGEQVIHFILQPEIRVPVIKILGKTYFRTISPTHMGILTDRELIMISEDEPQSRVVGRYGGSWNYIPLGKITSLTLKTANDLLVLSVQLQGSVWLDYQFQTSAKQELDQLLEKFNELTKR